MVGRENGFFKQNIGKGDNSTLVVRELANEFRAERLNAAPLFLGVDGLVKIEHVTPFFPWHKLALDTLNAAGTIFDICAISFPSSKSFYTNWNLLVHTFLTP